MTRTDQCRSVCVPEGEAAFWCSLAALLANASENRNAAAVQDFQVRVVPLLLSAQVMLGCQHLQPGQPSRIRLDDLQHRSRACRAAAGQLCCAFPSATHDVSAYGAAASLRQVASQRAAYLAQIRANSQQQGPTLLSDLKVARIQHRRCRDAALHRREHSQQWVASFQVLRTASHGRTVTQRLARIPEWHCASGCHLELLSW
mmetsp:Transcript_19428/g.43097  ORF Transcript_19428/g.43097 Transcript_19428/m.43097 type:complete len:202 (-) Transcript_19428:1558-2163(-)